MKMKGDVIYVEFTLSDSQREVIQKLYPIGPLVNLVSSYRHYGIDIGDGSVVHFTGKDLMLTNDATVQLTLGEQFSQGREYKIDIIVRPKYDGETVVRRAMNKVDSDFGGYDLLRNNCEHFANWCAAGERTSRQVFFLNDDQNVFEKLTENVVEQVFMLRNSTIH